MNEIDPRALFRLSVLGPLVSRERLERGELQQVIRGLAQREYAIPGTRRRHIGEKTIQGWYYPNFHSSVAFVPEAARCGAPATTTAQSENS